MKNQLLKLQNGADIRGIYIASPERPATMTADMIRMIAGGIWDWLQGKSGSKYRLHRIAIGRDPRVSGAEIAQLLREELLAYGAQIIYCDLATTPAMFWATQHEDYDADCAIMITASHLPYQYNGLKLFTKQGGAEKADITRILNLAAVHQVRLETVQRQGSVVSMPLLQDYASGIVHTIISKTGSSKPFDGMHIIVDAGNGAGGFYAQTVLRTLGANIEGSRFLEPDGMFPNHIPNPENEEAMESLCAAVRSTGADLGVIFDTDVDRAAIVTKGGASVNKNRLIALIADILLEEEPGAVIVTDSITSDALAAFIAQRGGVHHRFQRGYKNVINEAIRINREGVGNAVLAIETSGHAALKENYFLDDGSYLVSRLLMEAARLYQEGRTLESRIADLKESPHQREYRLKLTGENPGADAERLLESFAAFAKREGWEIVSPNYEGVKVRISGGWMLVRKSLHEPLLPVNLEAETEAAFATIERGLQKWIKENDGVDI